MVLPQLRQPEAHPFGGWDLPRLIDEQSNRQPDHPFLVWRPLDGPRQVWTYREFAEVSAAVAGGLAGLGVQPGDRVAVLLDNCPEFLFTWAACARLGAIVVTLNTRSAPPEIQHYVENSGAVGVVTAPELRSVLDLALHGVPRAKRWVTVTGAEVGGDDVSYNELMASEPVWRTSEPDPWTPFSIQYTSGTTSRPKGVLWTHGNVLWAARSSAATEALTGTDTQLIFLPLFHMNAISTGVLSTLWAGATAVLQPRFSASQFWPVSMEEGCTFASMIGFAINAIANQPVPDHRYRLWGHGASSPATQEQFGVPTIGWWAMTETTTLVIASSPHYDDAPGTMGRRLPLYEIVVLDDNGQPVAAGETGHLRVRGIPGVSLFHSYWANPEATDAAFDDDGYFITGDRVTLHANGTISFADRDKDMMKVGGENVAASEIERVVKLVEGVSEVAAVAAPDPMRSEVPVVFVIANDQASLATLPNAIANRCAAELADFKRPRQVFLVDELPRSMLNKVNKANLRAQLAAET